MAKKRYLIILAVCSLTLYLHAIPESDLRLTFLGDLMAHDVNFRINDFSVVYDQVKDILRSDDCTFTNLEAPVNEKEPYYTYPAFNMRRDYVQAAIDAGIDVFSLANNHSFDRGLGGIIQTISSLIVLKENKKLDLYYSGIRANKDVEFKPITIKKKGWKIGFIAVTQFLNTLLRNDYVHIVDYRRESEASQFIDYIKTVSREYDLLIVSYHGDIEYSLVPDPKKTEFFDRLVQAGCHIVYGHHPHVLQPFKSVSVNGNNRLIMYSMGNFISGQRWGLEPFDANSSRAYTGDSVMLSIGVDYANNNPDITIKKSYIITNHINEKREVVVQFLDKTAQEAVDYKWIQFYKSRLDIMNRFISEFFPELK